MTTLNRLAATTTFAFLALATFFSASSAYAQASPSSASPTHPALASTVPDGTRFLIRLEDTLSTKKHRAGKKFKARTLEPLVTTTGLLVPPGAEVRGHISRVEPATLTGRARLWLSFDDIKTRDGRVPLLADVHSVPGEHSVRVGPSREGEIEARVSRGQREVEAAVAGAAIGAVAGAATKGGKGAVIGAAIGAASGFLIASGMGQELELQKGTKIELELTRPLYLASR